MSNPRPQNPKADYRKLPADELVRMLEERMPGLSFNLHHMGANRPVMMNWRHNHAALGAWEQKNLHMKGGTYRDFKTGLVAMLERLDAFQEHAAAEQKRVAAEKKKARARSQMSLPSPARATKPAPQVIDLESPKRILNVVDRKPSLLANAIGQVLPQTVPPKGVVG